MASAAAASPATTVKHLTDTHTLTAVLPSHAFPISDDPPAASVVLPTVDLSALASAASDCRSEALRALGDACRRWGFFMVVNHGVPEKLTSEVIEACRGFFNLPEGEKDAFARKDVLDPIRCGTSFNSSVEKVFYWRDFLKVFMHPTFHSPPRPPSFSEISREYSSCVRKMVRILIGGISESLGLDGSHTAKALDLDDGLQILVANFYPPCPQPDRAIGLPPHSDHGLLTVLIENNVGGLQVMHEGKWVQAKSAPNSFLVNIGDHLEIFSNGRYKSVLHRAMVNSEKTRVSIAMGHGPSLDTLVGPAPQLVDEGGNPPAYRPMKYRDYLEFQQSNQLNGKTSLDMVRM